MSNENSILNTTIQLPANRFTDFAFSVTNLETVYRFDIEVNQSSLNDRDVIFHMFDEENFQKYSLFQQKTARGMSNPKADWKSQMKVKVFFGKVLFEPKKLGMHRLVLSNMHSSFSSKTVTIKEIHFLQKITEDTSTLIPDGEIIVGTQFQELGNGISASTFKTKMEKGRAILTVSNIRNNSIFDIKDIKGVIKFYDKNKNEISTVSSVIPLMPSKSGDGILTFTSKNIGIPTNAEGGFVTGTIVDPSENQIKTNSLQSNTKKDIFISHANEDKDVVRPLVKELLDNNVSVWYDEYSLKWGDSLMESINKGLSDSLYGIVVFSSNFFKKEWAKRELEALLELTKSGEKKILPLRYGLTHDELTNYAPLLSGKLSRSLDDGLETLVSEVKELVEEKNKIPE